MEGGLPPSMALRVRDVMTSDPSTVTPDTLLTAVADEIIEERYSGVPVVDEDDELVGIVEVGDLLPHPEQVPFSQVDVLEFQGEWVDEEHLENYYELLQELRVEAVMRTDPVTAERGAPLGKVIRRLLEEDARRIVVLDEGEVIGVVTRTDLLKSFVGWP